MEICHARYVVQVRIKFEITHDLIALIKRKFPKALD